MDLAVLPPHMDACLLCGYWRTWVEMPRVLRTGSQKKSEPKRACLKACGRLPRERFYHGCAEFSFVCVVRACARESVFVRVRVSLCLCVPVSM